MPSKPIHLPTEIDLQAFISEQAHDLRTPFNHIIGFSKMTLNTVGEAPLTDFQKEDLGTVYRSGLRALAYMNGLIDIARLNRGEKEPNLSAVNLKPCMDQSIAQWKKFNPGEVQVFCRWNTTTPSLQADPQMLQQVFTGLIAFVAAYCDTKFIVTITVDEEPGRLLFGFASAGSRARQLPELDLTINGFVCRALVELLHGSILQAEETDSGAQVQFALLAN